jgi:hypothetical protein
MASPQLETRVGKCAKNAKECPEEGDPYVSQWREWGACAGSKCGKKGTKKRVRECIKNEDEAKQCKEKLKETEECVGYCPPGTVELTGGLAFSNISETASANFGMCI